MHSRAAVVRLSYGERLVTPNPIHVLSQLPYRVRKYGETHGTNSTTSVLSTALGMQEGQSRSNARRLPRWTSRVRVPSPALKLATEAQASVAALLRAGDASRATPGPRAAPPPWVLRTRLRRVRVPKDFPYSRTEIKETPFARIARAIPGCARTHHPPRGAITHDRASYWTSTRTTDTPSRQDCTCQRERVSCPRCEFVPASFVSPPSA